MEIDNIILMQKNYFKSGETLNVKTRLESLKRLKENIKQLEDEICDSIKEDLSKSKTEAYMTEIGMVYEEINYMIKNIKRLSRPTRVRTPISQFPSKSYIIKEPYGNVLIMSPWNYPFNLTITPLVDAIAAGNTAVIKPSAYSPKTSGVVKKLIEMTFKNEYVAVIEGGREANQELLDKKFDYIFFTGSKNVGKLVLEKAAQYLTPVSLELGGKSPCVVTNKANLKIAARRIVFGKYLNLGQTCVAPDYLLVQKDVELELLSYIKQEIISQFGENISINPDYGKIINKKHFNRIIGLIEKEKVLYGGTYNEEKNQVYPTIIGNVKLTDPIMQEEIFGPLLPVLSFNSIEDVKDIVSENATPLAFYLFTNDNKEAKYLFKNIIFGGGCVNDTISHLANNNFGFGGVGESGMGSYHGSKGFDTFTHQKGILDKKNWLDLNFRYQPFKNKLKAIKKFLK